MCQQAHNPLPKNDNWPLIQLTLYHTQQSDLEARGQNLKSKEGMKKVNFVLLLY